MLSGDTSPCAGPFVLDEVGGIYLMAIREWATYAPATTARCRASPLDAEHRALHSVDDAQHRHHSQALGVPHRGRGAGITARG
jgi:hypothetical protein